MWRFFSGQGQGPVNQDAFGNNSVSQNDINKQILTQLSTFGDRLAAIENSTKTRPKYKIRLSPRELAP